MQAKTRRQETVLVHVDQSALMFVQPLDSCHACTPNNCQPAGSSVAEHILNSSFVLCNNVTGGKIK
jgi:hypothetical protein